MNRRHFLASAGLVLPVGSGCLSLGESTGTEPQSGTFDPIPEEAYWHRSIRQDPGPDPRSILATDHAISVGTGSRLSRISPNGTELWNVPARAQPDGLALSEEAVFYSGGGGMEGTPVIACHSAESGDERWWHEPEADPVLVDATPTTLYVGSRIDDPTSGLPVTALSSDSGERQWRRETNITRNGLVTHELCLIVSYPATLVAFARDSGDEQWRHQFDEEINGLHAVEDAVVLLTKRGVTVYELPSGESRWDKSFGEQGWIVDDGVGSEAAETIYVGGSDGTLRAIDLSSGEIQWSKSHPAENDGTRIIGIATGSNRTVLRKGNTLIGVNATDGREKWRQVLSPLYDVSAPLIIDETLFLLHSPEGEEVEVRIFDVSTGKRQWSYSMDLTDNLLPTPSICGDRLIVALQSGSVYGFSTN